MLCTYLYEEVYRLHNPVGVVSCGRFKTSLYNKKADLFDIITLGRYIEKQECVNQSVVWSRYESYVHRNAKHKIKPYVPRESWYFEFNNILNKVGVYVEHFFALLFIKFYIPTPRENAKEK